jgi:hypothetical protein
LKGTTNANLEFGRSDAKLTGYVDFDFMGDLDKIWSLTAYVFILGGCALVGRLLCNPLLHYQQHKLNI